MSSRMISNPVTRDDNNEKNRTKKIHLTLKWSSSSLTTLDPPPKMMDTKVEVEPPRTERSPWDFSESPRCWMKYTLKLKNNTNGQMPSAPEGGCKFYWMRSRPANQPQEGPLWKVQDKWFRPSETRRPVITDTWLHGTKWTLDIFIKHNLDRNYIKT